MDGLICCFTVVVVVILFNFDDGNLYWDRLKETIGVLVSNFQEITHRSRSRMDDGLLVFAIVLGDRYSSTSASRNRAQQILEDVRTSPCSQTISTIVLLTLASVLFGSTLKRASRSRLASSCCSLANRHDARRNKARTRGQSTLVDRCRSISVNL